MATESARRRYRRNRKDAVAAGLCADCRQVRDTKTRLCTACADKRVAQQKASRKIAEGKRAEMAAALGMTIEQVRNINREPNK